MRPVRLSERGYVDLDAATWSRLSSEADFWHLVDRKILRVSQAARHRIRLEGGAFVGRAVLGEDTLELTEKVRGALESLLGFATADAFRVEKLAAPASDLGALAPLLVRQFLEAVRRYVSRGREFRYGTRQEVGSLVGGRLDMTRTLALRARGLPHLAAFDQTILSRNIPKNRIVLRAIREVERIAQMVAMDSSILARARALSILFSDCRDAEVIFGKRERFVDQVERLLEGREGRRDEDLLRLAGVILSHESFEQTAAERREVPRAWFISLESLFESAVRMVLRALLAPASKVVSGSSLRPPIFSATSGEFRANPDLVLLDRTQVAAVGDVKYKEWTGSADPSDLYQLLVHAATFSSPVSFLVFPAERFEARSLGLSATGCATWLFSVDVRALRDDLPATLRVMNIGFAELEDRPEARPA